MLGSTEWWRRVGGAREETEEETLCKLQEEGVLEGVLTSEAKNKMVGGSPRDGLRLRGSGEGCGCGTKDTRLFSGD